MSSNKLSLSVQTVHEHAKTKPPLKRKKLTDAVRRIIAANQRWNCDICGELLDAWFEIDHIVALRNGGEDVLSNMRALHRSCHQAKTVWEIDPNKYEYFTGKSKYFKPGPLYSRSH
jgi:5-methylcytosine-specific restriction endonuclease McrA